MRPPHRLPRWADRILEWVLPKGVGGDSIRGDLAEEFDAMHRGPGRAVWLGSEVVRLAYHYRFRPRRGEGVASLRFALRRMRRDPGFTTVAVGTMALGVGATVALFSVVRTVLLEPLPYRDPEGLVAIFEGHAPRDVHRNVANPGNVEAWGGSDVLIGTEAAVLPMPRIVSGPGEPREVMTSIVTPGWLDLLGLRPALGRGFTPDAGAAGGSQGVLSHRGWTELLGGDPDVVGETLTVDGRSVRIVGVLPPTHVPFVDGSLLLLAMPLSAMGDQTSTGRFLNVVGRMAPDADLARVRTALEGVQSGLRERFPEFNAGWVVEVEPLRAVVLGDLRAPLWTLFVAGGLLLLVAAVNVANLTLARATERAGEMAVRAALGASGRRLAGQLVVESGVLALLGGVGGVALAWLVTRAVTPGLMEAFTIPRLSEVSLDPVVLAFAAAVSAGTGVLFGLAPAWTAARRSVASTLREEGRGPGRRGGRLRSVLVVAEVALSVVLATSAVLLARSLASVSGVDTGFEPDRVVTARVNLTGPRYADVESVRAFYGDLEEKLDGIPGVEAAGAVAFLPLDGLGSATGYYPADRAAPPRDEWSVADVRPVLGDYFAAMGIRLLAGRAFDERDGAGAPRVVVVSRSLAERAWPGEDPIGRPVAVDWDDLEPWTVVGVVEDVVHAAMEDGPREAVYHSARQAPYFPFMSLTLKTRPGDPGNVVDGLRRTLSDLDPGIPVTRIRTLDSLVRSATARPRITAFLVALFAGAAAALAAVGLYGVLAYAVSRRVREIGVRVALGARPRDVVALVTGQGMRLVVAGLVVGLAIAAVTSRALGTILFRVSAGDPWSFGGAALLFTVVGLAATLVPSLRAIRIRPGRALRED